MIWCMICIWKGPIKYIDTVSLLAMMAVYGIHMGPCEKKNKIKMALWSSWFNLGWLPWSTNRSRSPRKLVQRLPQLNPLQRPSPDFDCFPKPMTQYIWFFNIFRHHVNFLEPCHPLSQKLIELRLPDLFWFLCWHPCSLRNLLKMVTKNDEWSWGLELGAVFQRPGIVAGVLCHQF